MQTARPHFSTVPHIIDYQTVLRTLTHGGLSCTYHNSGSFAPRSPDAAIVGWTLQDDATIRPQMREHLRVLPSLATMIDGVATHWINQLPGEIWIMPASHWAFELSYGNADWLPATLQAIGIRADDLAKRNDGSAIALEAHDIDLMKQFVGDLLTQSAGSDFTAAWPQHATVALLHHHAQVWWRTTDESLAHSLRLFSSAS